MVKKIQKMHKKIKTEKSPLCNCRQKKKFKIY